jgi:hypothetical protein
MVDYPLDSSVPILQDLKEYAERGSVLAPLCFSLKTFSAPAAFKAAI